MAAMSAPPGAPHEVDGLLEIEPVLRGGRRIDVALKTMRIPISVRSKVEMRMRPVDIRREARRDMSTLGQDGDALQAPGGKKATTPAGDRSRGRAAVPPFSTSTATAMRGRRRERSR